MNIMINPPRTINEALERLATGLSSNQERWELLALILQQIAESQGVDLDREIEYEP
jgi:hypothetical protein